MYLLIDKISEGIGESDKFLISLSERSIEKPWIKAELRNALMDEIAGVKPEFIVPIKLGRSPRAPPFIESKRYIDLATKTDRRVAPRHSGWVTMDDQTGARAHVDSRQSAPLC